MHLVNLVAIGKIIHNLNKTEGVNKVMYGHKKTLMVGNQVNSHYTFLTNLSTNIKPNSLKNELSTEFDESFA